MNLQLKYLAPYLPYDILCKAHDTIIPMPMTSIVCGGMVGLIGTEDNIEFYEPYKVKPLLLPLSEIQKFMPEILKTLSKLDLSDCTFEENEYDEDINQWWCNAFDGDRVISCLTFDGNAFYIQYWHGTADDGFDLYKPQYEALQQLAKYHLDYQFLIDAGLALNKNDYIKQ